MFILPRGSKDWVKLRRTQKTKFNSVEGDYGHSRANHFVFAIDAQFNIYINGQITHWTDG